MENDLLLINIDLMNFIWIKSQVLSCYRPHLYTRMAKKAGLSYYLGWALARNL